MLGGGRNGVLRGGFSLVLVGHFSINGSALEVLTKLSWVSVRLWTWLLLPCVFPLHETVRL